MEKTFKTKHTTIKIKIEKTKPKLSVAIAWAILICFIVWLITK